MDSSFWEYDMRFGDGADESASLWTRLQSTGRWVLSKLQDHVIQPVSDVIHDSLCDTPVYRSGGKMTGRILHLSASPYDRPAGVSADSGRLLAGESDQTRPTVQASGILPAQPRGLFAGSYTVSFRRINKPNEDLFYAYLDRGLSCEKVTKYVAGRIGLADPTRIRLWSHCSFTGKPFGHFDNSPACILARMCDGCYGLKKILYFEELVPLTVESRLETVQVAFYHRNGRGVSVHNIELWEHEFTVKNMVKALRAQWNFLFPITLFNENTEIRLLEVIDGKKIKVFENNELINFENYKKPDRSLHAEEAIEMERNLKLGEFFVRILRYKEEGKEVKRAGELTCICQKGNTFADIKRYWLRNTGGFSKRDIEASKFIFYSPLRAQELKDSDVLSDLFQKNLSEAWTEYIEWEHKTVAKEVPKQKRRRDSREEDNDVCAFKKPRPGFHITAPDFPSDDEADEEFDWSAGFGSPIH